MARPMNRSMLRASRTLSSVTSVKASPSVVGAARAADAVHVVLRILRHVVVDDVRHAGDVEAAGGEVGGDQHLVAAGLETLQRLLPFALVAVRSASPRPNACATSAGQRRDRRPILVRQKIRTLSNLVRSSSVQSRSNFCEPTTG